MQKKISRRVYNLHTWDFCPDASGGTIVRTARSTAVCHTLGILMPSRNQIQPDPAVQYTHNCLLGRRERVTVQAGLAIPRRVQQGQFGSGCSVVFGFTYIIVSILITDMNVYTQVRLMLVVCEYDVIRGNVREIEYSDDFLFFHPMLKHPRLVGGNTNPQL